ncbi:MAG: TRAM domain-containing protein [Candidatus Aenigmatarchaeota archaeon]
MGYGDRSYGRGGYGRGGYSGGYERELPKPIKAGDELDVEIEEVGTKGDGIARVKNFVVFVAGAKKGEKIRIRIKDVMSRFATAEKVGAGGDAVAAPAEAEAAVEADGEAIEEEVSEAAEAEEAAEELEADEEPAVSAEEPEA